MTPFPSKVRFFYPLIIMALLFLFSSCSKGSTDIDNLTQELCVLCHACGTDGTLTEFAPIIDKTHDVCNSCHQPDGSVDHSGEGGSCEWEMDCEANPPIVNCNNCHSTEYVNNLCLACHSDLPADHAAKAPRKSCSADEDCSLGEICTNSYCIPGCLPGSDRCPPGTTCIDGYCQQETSTCPTDMVSVNDLYCIDRYESSRPDATDTNAGTDSSRATSRPNVLPWWPISLTGARQACAAAGKRLCQPDEFQTACEGHSDTTYPYGNTYEPTTCNGIDTYCKCGAGETCEGVSPCPYPHCYNTCGSNLKVMPTGSFTNCVNEYGAYDLSGNVWERVDDGTDADLFRGGAFNCIDSETLHRCDHTETNISAKGFRCCLMLSK